MSDQPPSPPAPTEWPPEQVRRLRGHLALSQGGLAERIGTKQQTISQWETGASRPRRMSRRLLHLVAEESGFYDASGSAPAPPQAPSLDEEHGS